MSRNKTKPVIANDTSSIVNVITCGARGLALRFEHEPENCLHHVQILTKAAAGMHRAIELAQRNATQRNATEKLPTGLTAI